MSDASPINESLALPAQQTILRVLEDLATSIPHSEEPTSNNPKDRAHKIARTAALKAGAMSAGLAVPPGPLGILTIIPDLMKVWQIQRQMVADIAACFGKSVNLNRQTMIYCLFRHGAAMLARDILARVGERVVVKSASVRTVQKLLQRISIEVTQKAVAKTLGRWIPVVGPVLIGGYSLMDTRSVGKTAIDTFSRDIEVAVET
jgi:hypothetical protein